MMRYLIASLCLLATTASADVITLDNGDRISGSIVAMNAGKLSIESPYAGKVTVPWEAVTGLESDAELRFQLIDNTRLSGQATAADRGKMRVEGGEVLESVAFGLDKVSAINPPTLSELEKVKTSGKVDVGLSGTSGNSETERFHLGGRFTARTKDNRFTAGLQYNKGEDDGETTVDNATVYMNYDHFVSEKWFATSSMTLQQNDLQNLDLRTAVGAGMGYQFRDSDELKLSASGGLSYLAEEFTNAESERSIAARWALDYEHAWTSWLDFFHNHELLYSIEDSDDWVFISRSGLRFPIAEKLDGSFQLNYDFDNSPAPGAEEEDITYIFNVGYSWD